MSDNNTRYVKGVPRLHLLLSTGCGLGFFPKAPATAAGFVALLLWYGAYLLLPAGTLLLTTVSAIVVTAVVGIWTADVMERYWGPDPRAVVIDEFVGAWIPLLVAADTGGEPCFGSAQLSTAVYAFAGFALFRVIDIFKPLGCRWIDTHVHGGIGCILDDVLAGTYALFVVLLIKVF